MKDLVVKTVWGPIPEAGLLLGRSVPELSGMPLIMSRKHCMLTVKDGAVHCMDYRSLNGTYIAVRLGGDSDETATLTLSTGGNSVLEALAEAEVESGLTGEVKIEDCNGLLLLSAEDAGEPIRLQQVVNPATLDIRYDFIVLGCTDVESDKKPFPTHVCVMFTQTGETDTAVEYTMKVAPCQVKTFPPAVAPATED